MGYRRDLVATLASLSHGNADVVREIVAVGTHKSRAPFPFPFTAALYLQLTVRRRCAHCRAAVPRRRRSVAARAVHTIDTHSHSHCDAEDTFVREWALFAVRNMCEVSAEAQQVIRCVTESVRVLSILRLMRPGNSMPSLHPRWIRWTESRPAKVLHARSLYSSSSEDSDVPDSCAQDASVKKRARLLKIANGPSSRRRPQHHRSQTRKSAPPRRLLPRRCSRCLGRRLQVRAFGARTS